AVEDDSKGYILYVRDYNIEQTYINLLLTIVEDCYLEQDRFFGGSIKPEKFIINYTDANTFLIEYGARLATEGYEIRFKQKKIRPISAGGRVQKRVTSGIDWFEISLSYKDYEGEEYSLKIEEDLLKSGLIRHKDEYIPLSPEDIQQLKTISQNTIYKNDKYNISKYNFARIEELKETVADKEKKIFEETMALYERLKNFKSIKKYALPKKFKAKLRDYQKEGYRWLMFLKEYKVNGCLADDMGLGKTIQTLALFQKLKEEANFKTSLLVVPVSTIPNWSSEIERFCDNFNVAIHLGQSRIREINFILSHDLIITSYHTLARDIKFFKDIKFYYIVIDEAQAIKNSRSQSFETITSINAKHRISLTGTPVENSCSDLYSQMEFLHPGLLGTQHSFRKNYLYPIEKSNDKEVAEDLRKTVFPFIMRRKKEDVARDLPEKEEITYYVEMHPKQHKLYETYRKKIKGDLDKEIEKKGLPGASMAILEAMLRLRQMALFPQLVNQYFDPVESAKFEVLKDLLEEITSENHKVLVFSQFVESLKIIRSYCDSMKWDYSYIDGSTKKREIQIKNFQSNEKIKIFLLSIKAGGVGINLTAADYVIIFDPWWNPAVESQAIDRSHRIGQINKVIAYKLIVKNTIEEKMLELQNRKKDLVNNLITEEKSFFKSLTKNDIDYILS
ncbi:MAG TPA: DEAD/DEAH box helicase, partial [Spirochaetota bacterium]|nr:DEAD/DEAH box helicase [Spirochaetota bacterium]